MKHISNNRNGAMDFLKFVFSIEIAIYHFYDGGKHFPGGAYAVSFFALASGIYFFDSYMRRASSVDTSYPLIRFKERFQRFFSYTFQAFIFAYVVKRIFIYQKMGKIISFDRLLEWAVNDIWEIFLLDMAGLNNNASMLNSPIWYISALLLVEFIIASLLVVNKERFFNIFAPISIVVSFSLILQNESFNYKLWSGFTTNGLLRIYAIMCASLYCWRLMNKIKATEFTRTGTLVLTGIEFSCYAMSVYIMMNYESRYFYLANILLFLFGVAITASGKSYAKNIFPASVGSNIFAELSFSIYLTHHAVLALFRFYYPTSGVMYSQKYFYLAAVLAVAIIFNFTSKKVCILSGHVFKFFCGKMVVLE